MAGEVVTVSANFGKEQIVKIISIPRIERVDDGAILKPTRAQSGDQMGVYCVPD